MDRRCLAGPPRWTSGEATDSRRSRAWVNPIQPSCIVACIVHSYHLQNTGSNYKDFLGYVEAVFATFSANQKPIDRRLWIRLSSSKRSDVAWLAELLISDAVSSPYPFILITTDGDNTPETSCPSKQFYFLLKHAQIVAWFSQNCNTNHPKLHPIPIGFDLHSSAIKRSHFAIFSAPSTLFMRESIQVLSVLKATRAPSRQKSILYDMGSSSHPERQMVANILRKRPSHIHSLKKRIAVPKIWQMYCSHEAGISVRGNGLDCHRTWEMLFLGMVPILRKQNNAFDNLFKGLPVVLVDDWEELLKTQIFDRISHARAMFETPNLWFTENFWLKKCTCY